MTFNPRYLLAQIIMKNIFELQYYFFSLSFMRILFYKFVEIQHIHLHTHTLSHPKNICLTIPQTQKQHKVSHRWYHVWKLLVTDKTKNPRSPLETSFRHYYLHLIFCHRIFVPKRKEKNLNLTTKKQNLCPKFTTIA